MPTPKQASSGVLSARSKQAFLSAPGTMGFSNLTTPDDAFNKLSFNVQMHFTDDQALRLIELVEQHSIKAVWPQFLALMEAEKKPEPKGGWAMPSAQAWVEAHMKDPSERSRTQLPSIQFANEAEYKGQDGLMVRKTMHATDLKGNKLDIAKMKLGMGSTIQAVLMGGLFISGLVKQPQVTLKLQGIRVLKLVQYGGGQGAYGELSDEDLSLVGDDFEPEDLSGFAAGDTSQGPATRAAHEDLSDSLPF